MVKKVKGTVKLWVKFSKYLGGGILGHGVRQREKIFYQVVQGGIGGGSA